MEQQDWRKELRKQVKGSERMSIERVKMPELEASYRSTNQEEVNCGLELSAAVKEAQRCLDCAKPNCKLGCPVGIDIPRFVKQVEIQDFPGAIKTIKESSSLPAVCGRVCPQEKQCEAQCVYVQKLNKPAVAIGYLERFVADYNRMEGTEEQGQKIEPLGIKMAVIGSGPAGLACAADLIQKGYAVTVFEALHELGGVLRYGIPEFRLPNDVVDFEINKLKELGVEFKTNCIIGKTISFEGLREEGFKAFFVSSGAGLPRFMNIPGENLVGVMSANEYLTRVNLMQAGKEGYDTPVLSGKNIMVIGGGNTAMDAVRTAKRSQAERAILVYRRTEEEMPARLEEVKHAKEEGVEFFALCNPVAYEGDENGRLNKVRLQVMELGEPDESGRRRPVPKPGEELVMDVDLAIVSVGVSPNPLISQVLPDLKMSKWGTIEVNEQMQSSIPDIYAGGDIVRGGATVILAMGDGRKAAQSMHEQAGVLKN